MGVEVGTKVAARVIVGIGEVCKDGVTSTVEVETNAVLVEVKIG